MRKLLKQLVNCTPCTPSEAFRVVPLDYHRKDQRELFVLEMLFILSLTGILLTIVNLYFLILLFASSQRHVPFSGPFLPLERMLFTYLYVWNTVGERRQQRRQLVFVNFIRSSAFQLLILNLSGNLMISLRVISFSNHH